MRDYFIIGDDMPMTAETLAEYIQKNDSLVTKRYQPLLNAYENDYEIYHQKYKPTWKPDNRLSVNFAQYITDTFEGFFLGNPVKVYADDEGVSEYVNFLDAYNDQDDQNAELSTLVSIFGRAYEMYYVDEDGENCIAYLDPISAFMIYSDSIKPRPKFFVRTYVDANGTRRGSISDEYTVKYFVMDPDVRFVDDERIHGYAGVPAVEYIQNSSRRGIFESVLPLINAYNKALSEKANDVDAFADAYLKILGKQLDEETITFMRDNRVINFEGNDIDHLVVEFMQKPDGDNTQEHLLERLERLIFVTAMVCNINDENFATSSGIALQYKLLPMLNLAAKKERKFTSGMNRRYKLLFSNPVSGMQKDAWAEINYVFNFNIPNNIADEAETAQKLNGIVSKRTQLSVISAVQDIDAEMEELEREDADSMLYDTVRSQVTEDAEA